MEQANAAYQQTADHLDTAVRAANPGMDHPLAMSFEQIVHSIYMTAILQLGGTTKPGEQPRIDLLERARASTCSPSSPKKPAATSRQPSLNYWITLSSKSAWASSRSPRPSPVPPPTANPHHPRRTRRARPPTIVR